MNIKLDKHQTQAIDKLRTGSILNGGVGSGKSRAAIAYYYLMVGKGSLKINGIGKYEYMTELVDLLIITTARKRDTLEWEDELAPFGLTNGTNQLGINITIDSWNNIKKYQTIKNTFVIFDEQRVVGSGAWVKAFHKITKQNKWILLSATPGDTWLDYIPVFIANGFYKNRTEFLRQHVVFNPFVKFPMVDRYVDTQILERYRNDILVKMKYRRHTTRKYRYVWSKYDEEKYNTVLKKRWNVFKDKPIENVSELGHALRRIMSTDSSRLKNLLDISKKHDRLIIFYNFDYELMLLRDFGLENSIPTNEWNGHKHEPIPSTDRWLYLVQYESNKEGWNCIQTNAMVFFSQSYSYRTMEQSSGRIDRRNTPYDILHYYILICNAPMDLAIRNTVKNKKNFNETKYLSDM